MRKRPAARILLIDHDGRLLLFRYRHDDGPLAGMSYWATPGGALAEGETYAQAARRELREETGIDADVGDEVASRHIQFVMPDGTMVDADERFFMVRTSLAIDAENNPDPVERAFIAEAKWWTGAELRATADIVYPDNVAAMIEAALKSRHASGASPAASKPIPQ